MPNSKKYNSHSHAFLKASFPRLSVRAIDTTFKKEHDYSFTPSYETLRVITHVISNDSNQVGEEDDHEERVRARVLEVAPFLENVSPIVLKQDRVEPKKSYTYRLLRGGKLDAGLLHEIARIPALEDWKENLLPSRGQPKEPEPDDDDRDNGETRECGCCMDDFLATEMVHCGGGNNESSLHPNCHFFCKACLQRHVSEQLFGKNQALVQCMSIGGCTNTFGNDTFDNVLTPRTKKNFDIRRVQEAAREAGIDLCQCPKCDEQFEKDELLGDLECPFCEFKSCLECKKESHPGQTCEQAEQEQARNDARNKAENAMTAAVVRECPSCKIPFQKGGTNECNKIKCTACGTVSCYLCRQEINLERPYEHFCQTPHCSHLRCGKCVLFTNTKEDDRQARRQAGRAEVQKAAAGGVAAMDIETLLSPEREQGQGQEAGAGQGAAVAHHVAAYNPLAEFRAALQRNDIQQANMHFVQWTHPENQHRYHQRGMQEMFNLQEQNLRLRYEADLQQLQQVRNPQQYIQQAVALGQAFQQEQQQRRRQFEQEQQDREDSFQRQQQEAQQRLR